MNLIKTSKLIGQTMHERGLSANKLSTGTGLNSYQIKKVIDGTASDKVMEKVCSYLEIEPVGYEPTKQGTARAKAVGPDKYIVTINDHGTERIEIMNKDDTEKLKDRFEVTYEEIKKAEDISKPLITDDDPMLEMQKEMWVDGKKYTEDDIRIMVESAVAEHREHVVLMDKVTCLQNKLDDLEERYTARDKEAIRLQVQVEELTEQLQERAESASLESMTIGESIKMYRTLKKLFKDEVLG